MKSELPNVPKREAHRRPQHHGKKISLRIQWPEGEYERIRWAANWMSKSMSAFISDAAWEATQEVIRAYNQAYARARTPADIMNELGSTVNRREEFPFDWDNIQAARSRGIPKKKQ